MFQWTYKEYKEIIENVMKTGRYCDYADVLRKPEMPFIVLRHDVELSPQRALQIQEIENELNFKSSYFFQIANNSYNAFSNRNIDIIKEIYNNGHHIGLHYHLRRENGIDEIIDNLKKELTVMSDMLGIRIDRFSYHRPPGELLSADIEIDGAINTYGSKYFTYAQEITAQTPLEVKYIADSCHRWTFGYPDKETIDAFPKMQILIHPYSWTPSGYDNAGNFRSLITEKNAELIETIDAECKHFREVRDEI